jgi:heme/copper-type cytochrome/quinol oxidase subunit 3
MISALPLFLCIAAPPLAWATHLMVNYALIGGVCYPGSEPLTAVLPAGHFLWWLLPLVDVVALAVCGGTAMVSHRTGQATEVARTRFLARWGVLLGIGFLIATLFDGVALFMVPLCAA